VKKRYQMTVARIRALLAGVVLCGLIGGGQEATTNRPAGGQQMKVLLGVTERISVGMNGEEANGPSEYANISADGRYVAFHSLANNLVANDNNGSRDVFLYDRQTGSMERISLDWVGNEHVGDSTFPDLSGDGRYVAFHSVADGLVAGDDNGYLDVFVHDRQNGLIERVSVHNNGQQGNEVSIFADISADGRYVAFYSLADNLVDNDGNESWDVFVHDRLTDVTERMSVDSLGQEAAQGGTFPDMSADEHYVVFNSISADLVAGDGNGVADVFVHDRVSGQTILVSANAGGEEGDAASSYATLSENGRLTAFSSLAGNLVVGDEAGWEEVFVHDRVTGELERLTVGIGGVEPNGYSAYPYISADGRYVAFDSAASNLVADDGNGSRDVFVYDRVMGVMERISVTSGGQEGIGNSSDVAISADGCEAVYHSAASLALGDTNGAADVYIRVRCPYISLPPALYFPAVYGP
jgi:Tol biopolymer transport system component